MTISEKGETEVKKDKEWAFIELGKLFPSHAEMYDFPDDITVMKCELLNKVYDILAQLDEPEVLSWEETTNMVLDDLKDHIKEQQALSQNVGLAHTSAGNDTHYRQYDYVLECINEYEPSDYLQNLLVPKQELPVIPKFVAEYIVKQKAFDSPLVYVISQYLENAIENKKVVDWIYGNFDVFVKAWLYGYTVGEEQKYILSINITDKASKTNYETLLNKRGIFHSMENDSFNSEEFNWTEEEIKDLENGEILFEHFAVKVEEEEAH